MALRSVVVEGPPSPPAPRRTVVLRAGGPAPKGRWIDAVIGILGALLLLSAIVLAAILPDKTYVNPQFRLTFLDQEGEGDGTTVSPMLTPDAPAFDFPLEMPDNVKTITLEMSFSDDIVYSLPDIFKVELVAPNGTVVGTIPAFQNDPPKGRNATETPQTYSASTITTFSGWADHQEAIVGGLTHTETVEQVQARLEPQYRAATAGTWIARVTLTSAQGCPQDPNTGFDGQYFYCRFGHPSDDGYPQSPGSAGAEGTDPGNVVVLNNYRYTSYLVTVEELK